LCKRYPYKCKRDLYVCNEACRKFSIVHIHTRILYNVLFHKHIEYTLEFVKETYMCAKKICIDVKETCIYVKETCIYVTETCVYVKETCIYVKDTCIYVKETCIYVKETCIYVKETCIYVTRHATNYLLLGLYLFKIHSSFKETYVRVEEM